MALHIIYKQIIYCLCLLLFVFSRTYAQEKNQCIKDEISIGWMPFEPFMEGDISEVPTGLDIQLIDKIFSEAHCQYKFVYLPWKRSIHEIRYGRLDMISLASITEERRSFANFSVPYRFEQMRLMIKVEDKNKWRIKSLKDIAKQQMRVAVHLGAFYGKEFEQLKENDATFAETLFTTTDDSTRLRMLQYGRIDAVLHDKTFLESRVKKMGLDGKFIFLDYPVNDDPIHFMFSKASVPIDDIERINKAVIKIGKTRFYQKLYHYSLSSILEKRP
ncbi:substrate-binding periplasmic protein [Zooshikella ganghwensis]|uniref:substrate-binding periplasmic protein n=1 Tax=Zooshikella ganghwensis TaxID=202772 RepID=UPI000417BB02|nr:transporter substrate-binding domain-containing protein [Zooshikella ganghwensis]